MNLALALCLVPGIPAAIVAIELAQVREDWTVFDVRQKLREC